MTPTEREQSTRDCPFHTRYLIMTEKDSKLTTQDLSFSGSGSTSSSALEASGSAGSCLHTRSLISILKTTHSNLVSMGSTGITQFSLMGYYLGDFHHSASLCVIRWMGDTFWYEITNVQLGELALVNFHRMCLLCENRLSKAPTVLQDRTACY